MKKRIVTGLVVALMCTFITPAIKASAMSNENDNNIAKLNELKVDVEQLKKDSAGTQYENLAQKAINAADKVEANVDGVSDRFNSDTVYDLNSIGVRIQLLTKSVEAMRFGTTDLADKVQTAHTKLGGAVTIAIIKALDPFASVDSITAEIGNLDKLMQELATYPVAGPNDIATIYYKAKLDKAIWETRFERDKKVLGKTTFAVYNELNRNITKAVGVQLNPTTKIVDVDKAIVDLKAALNVALSQVK